MRWPAVVVHADWGVRPTKRWLARASLDARGVYCVTEPAPVGEPRTLLRRLLESADRSEPVLVGFDFPIGLPAAYAAAAGVESFIRLLPELGEGRWRDFYRVAERPEEISLRRPFYPQRPGGTSQAHLLSGLGVARMDDLLRRCERPTLDRPRACSLFWTLGPNQVGKAAISGWRDVLAPALRDPAVRVALWPFDGRLEDLLREPRVVVAETYPSEVYRHLKMKLRGSKQHQLVRGDQAAVLTRWRERPEIAGRAVYTPEVEEAIRSGFGPGADGEDRFDAFVGLVGMLDVVLGRRRPGDPAAAPQRAVEGWILGQAPAEAEAFSLERDQEPP